MISLNSNHKSGIFAKSALLADWSMSTEEAKIILTSVEGQHFRLERRHAMKIGSLRHLVEDAPDGTILSIPSVTSYILAKVIEYLELHQNDICTTSMTPTPLPTSLNEDSDDEVDGVGKVDINEDVVDSDSDDEFVMEEAIAKVSPLDEKFIASLDLPTLVELVKAANYLNMAGLLDLGCWGLAREMSGLTAEELRKKFNLPNDFTPEEEEAIREEPKWIDQ